MDLINILQRENPSIYKNQYSLIRGISLSSMVSTMNLAFTWIAMDLLRKDKDIKFTKAMEGDLIAYVPLGALIGSLAAPKVLDAVGRRASLMFLSLYNAFSWMTLYKTNDAQQILNSRFTLGIYLGFQSTAATVYAGETIIKICKPLAHIGRTNSGGTGILLLVVLRCYFGFGWRALAKIMAIVSLGVGFLFIDLPCSPYRMYKKYGPADCMASLRFILQDRHACERQFRTLQSICNREEPQRLNVTDLFTNSPANMLGLTMITMQQLTGISIVTFYSETLLSQIIDKKYVATCVISLGSLNALIHMLSSISIYYSRIDAIKISNSFILNILIVMWLHFACIDLIGSSNYMHLTNGIVTPFAMVYIVLFIWAFNIGWGRVAEEYLIESIGVVQRHMACGIINAVKWAIMYIICRFFPYMFHILRFGHVFLLLAILFNSSFTSMEQNIVERNLEYSYRLY